MTRASEPAKCLPGRKRPAIQALGALNTDYYPIRDQVETVVFWNRRDREAIGRHRYNELADER